MREPGLCEILARTEESTLDALIELLPEEIEVVRLPMEGLVLMTCREPLGERFHLAEVLVAESQVSYLGTAGHAMVVGGTERQALAAAAIDALLAHPQRHSHLSLIEDLLEPVRAEILSERIEAARVTASTRVEFDLMPGA